MSASKWKATITERGVNFALGSRLASGALNERLAPAAGLQLATRRLVLRPLKSNDFYAWQHVRLACGDWLTRWEPKQPSTSQDPTLSRAAFDQRCQHRERDRTSGISASFGIFEAGRFIGECNLNAIQRGAQQSAEIGYWVDKERAGNAFTSEAVIALIRYAFEELGLHRIQICIVPRNTPSHRVVEKLGLRNEGITKEYLEINGSWEDHSRYGITCNEWDQRRSHYFSLWF